MRTVESRATLIALALCALLPGPRAAHAARATPGGTPPAPRASPAAPGPDAKLAAVDGAFFAAYEQAVERALATAPPALLVLGGRMILYRRGNRQEVSLTPARFAALKAVAHVPLGLFAALALDAGHALDDARLAALARYRTEIVAARDAVAALDLDAKLRARQNDILAATLETADATLAARSISPEALTGFCRRTAPLLLADVSDAVRLYLDALDRGVASLLHDVPASEQRQLLVVVSGVHQARIDNAAVQYFERLLGNPPVVDQRVIYAENVAGEAGALHLLGIHLMARRVGDAFFADPTFMNTDLFGHAAKQIVPELRLPRLGG